ncbi:MAG: TIGR03067 domain-containing protein [Planctomycetia bacterium]|nr:TIGR03067 domain-containing protein [Planctomycetia bacterium]
MRTGLVLTVALVLVILAGSKANDNQDEKPVDPDLKKLQGKWEITYHETVGVEDTEDNKWIIEVRGDKYTLTVCGKTLTGRVKVDSTKTPKQVEYATEEDGEVCEYVGIYELTADTFKTCDVLKGNERPTEFKTKDPTGQVAVWKRLKVRD